MSFPSIRPKVLQQGNKPLVEQFSMLRMIARDMPHKGICEEFGLVYKATTEDGRTYTEINYKPVTNLRRKLKSLEIIYFRAHIMRNISDGQRVWGGRKNETKNLGRRSKYKSYYFDIRRRKIGN